MPTLEATRIVRYSGRDQQPGDRFEASDKDAKVLIAIQKAKLSEGPAKSPSDLPDEVMSRASEPEPEPEPVAEEDEVEEPATEVAEVEKDLDPKPAQTYLHRAMVAEAPKAKPVEPMRFTPSPSPTNPPAPPASRPPGRTGRGKKSRS